MNKQSVKSLLVVLFLGVSLSLSAQTLSADGHIINTAAPNVAPVPDSLQDAAHIKTKKMLDKLNLNEDQYKKVLQINTDYQNQLQQGTKDDGAVYTDEDKQKLLKDRNQKFSEVLTKEQMERYKLVYPNEK